MTPLETELYKALCEAKDWIEELYRVYRKETPADLVYGEGRRMHQIVNAISKVGKS